MANTSNNFHDEDLLSDIMETLSAALVLNPKFDFGKLMDLSADINAAKNKTTLTDIISLAFLNYLGMTEAAAVLSTENIAAEAGYKALNLSNEEALLWFVRFIAVTNPVIIATMSQTLMNVVNGLMLQNTRSTDAERLHKVKSKLDKFVESGEAGKRAERLLDDKPSKERTSRREASNLGLIGWIVGTETLSNRRVSSSTNSSKSSTSKKGKGKASEKEKKKGREKDIDEESGAGSLREYISALSVDNDEVKPDDSISNNSTRDKSDDRARKSSFAGPSLSAKKRVQIRDEESIVSF